MTHSPLAQRSSLAKRILQLDKQISLLKGSRSPTPAALLRRSLLTKRTALATTLHTLTQERITQRMLRRHASPTPA